MTYISTVCPNCHTEKRLYRFRVLTVEKKRTRTFDMHMCAECSQQLVDILSIASVGVEEMLHAS